MKKKIDELSLLGLNVYRNIVVSLGTKINITGITVHNSTACKSNSADRYAAALKNGMLGQASFNFIVDEKEVQLLAPLGELTYHAGDTFKPDGTANKSGGNYTTISIECCMTSGYTAKDMKAEDNCAKLCAILCHVYKLPVSKVVTHTYWVNEREGKHFDDPAEQSANVVYGKKWCPYYIFRSTGGKVARSNWKAFLAKVEGYLYTLEHDLDGDSVIGEKDAVLLSRYLAGWKVNIDLTKADLNGDGVVDEKDAVTISRYLTR